MVKTPQIWARQPLTVSRSQVFEGIYQPDTVIIHEDI